MRAFSPVATVGVGEVEADGVGVAIVEEREPFVAVNGRTVPVVAGDGFLPGAEDFDVVR